MQVLVFATAIVMVAAMIVTMVMVKMIMMLMMVNLLMIIKIISTKTRPTTPCTSWTPLATSPPPRSSPSAPGQVTWRRLAQESPTSRCRCAALFDRGDQEVHVIILILIVPVTYHPNLGQIMISDQCSFLKEKEEKKGRADVAFFPPCFTSFCSYPVPP